MKEDWEKYLEKEISIITPIIRSLGFSISLNQPHIKGERYLMSAVTTKAGKKIILLGNRASDNKKVVIKITNDKYGAEEIEHERKCREVLKRINFAYQIFFSPKEIIFTKKDGYTIFIQEFIEQEVSFLDRSLKEQFTLALNAFKGQESAHATTFEHFNLIRKNFGQIRSSKYLENLNRFNKKTINETGDEELSKTINRARIEITNNLENIEQYCGFLTHADFVPHNIRVVGNDIYLLDSSSMRFGNKYEGWARFLNFMVLYNKPLEEALVKYVSLNRTPEESLSFHLMRIYRLCEIISYYTETIKKSEGNLLILNKKRIYFWAEVLKSLLNNKPIENSVIEEYKKSRDSLRDEDEKVRQVGLH